MQLEFHTGSLRGAGTDATVTVVLAGERGESGPVRVDAPLEAFERGGIDAFTFRLRRLGRLRHLVVSHDNTGRNPAWYLLKVVVTSTHPEEPEVGSGCGTGSRPKETDIGTGKLVGYRVCQGKANRCQVPARTGREPEVGMWVAGHAWGPVRQ